MLADMRPKEPRCVVLINGVHRISVIPPQEMNQTVTDVTYAEHNIMRQNPQYNLATGKLTEPVKLQFVFLYVNNEPKPDNWECPVYAYDIYVDGVHYPLGIVFQNLMARDVTYSHETGNVPHRIVFACTRTTLEGQHQTRPRPPEANTPKTDEEEFIEEIIEAMRADKFRGSLPSTYIQSLVMHSPYYKKVMAQYNNRWHNFLASHSVFTLFKYTADEIRHHKLGSTCHANELRLGLRDDGDLIIQGDMQRSHVRQQAESEVFHYLYHLLSTYGECDSLFLMKELERNCPAYQTFMHASYNMLERLVRQNDGLFTVTDDPENGTFVQLNRKGKVIVDDGGDSAAGGEGEGVEVDLPESIMNMNLDGDVTEADLEMVKNVIFEKFLSQKSQHSDGKKHK